MAISDYERTIYNMRSVPLKRTKEVEERLITALEMATAQLGSIIGRTDNPLSIKVYQGKRMKVVQMMNELGIRLKRDITSAISEVANDVAFTEQDATNGLLLEHDDANLMVDFTEIPRQTADLLAQRYDVDGLRISSSIWAQSQVGEIENVVLSGIARGQSARDMSNQLSQFMVGGGTGMGTSVRAKAMRLARTEINNAYWESARRASIESPVVKGIRWELSGRHPEYDVCNLLAESDLFELGIGVYPSQYLPPKPHPNCLCYQVDVLRGVDEWDEPKKEYSGAELDQVLGSVEFWSDVQYPTATGSERFKQKQAQLFRDSVTNTIKPSIPIADVPTAVVDVTGLPPDSPVAKMYDILLTGGEENSERLKQGYRRGANLGMDVGEWEQTMTPAEIGGAMKLGQRIRSDEVPISINFPTHVLEDMIESGRSKNLFETKTGLGSTDEKARAGWEKDLINVGAPKGEKKEAGNLYSQMPAEQKPTYGALNLGNDVEGGASSYGNAWLELENHVKHKSTFTPANSSQAKGVSTFKNAEPFFQYKRGRDKTANVENNTKPAGYLEVQVWDGIDYKKDVKAIHITADDLGVLRNEELSKAYTAEATGMEVDVSTEENLERFAEKFDVELIIHERE